MRTAVCLLSSLTGGLLGFRGLEVVFIVVFVVFVVVFRGSQFGLFGLRGLEVAVFAGSRAVAGCSSLLVAFRWHLAAEGGLSEGDDQSK